MTEDKADEKVCRQVDAPEPEPDDVVEPEPEAPVMLTANQILTCEDQQTQIVPVPEWGGSVLVWGMNGVERDQYEQAAIDQRVGKAQRPTVKGLMARLVVVCVRNEKGKRLFNVGHIPALRLRSGAALNRVSEVAMKLSGLSDADIEEMVKNSERIQSDDSGSS